MGTIIASQSLAAGATVTSAAFPFSVYDDITVTVLNGAAAPIQPPQITLLLSPDNVNYTAVDRRTTGMTPSQAYYHLFPLSNYAGWSPSVGAWDFLSGAQQFTGTLSGLTAGAVNVIQSAKIQIVNSGTVNAITVAANDGCTQNLAVIPLIGTSSTSGGGQLAWQPPGAQRIIITRAILDVTTHSTGAANWSIGVGASPTTSYVTLFQNVIAVGANITQDQIENNLYTVQLSTGVVSMAAGNYLTISASATSVGLIGNLYIQYLKP